MTTQSQDNKELPAIWRSEEPTSYGPAIVQTLNFALYEMVLQKRVGLPC